MLEAEFETTMTYIEPVPENDRVFSLQLAKQLLAICAQFETICRLRVAETNQESKARKIDGFYLELSKEKRHLKNAWAMLLTTNERICPFADWTETSPPPWWTAHNKVKHDPSIQLEKETC